jgi:diacylglycerol kinase family enzyme
MMNCVLIVTNFDAGRKHAVRYKKRVIDFVLKYTKSFKFVDIDEFRELDLTPYDTILAMGGDGTVNKVIPYVINTDKVLGIIPCGTANLLAANLGLSGNINKTLKIIEKQYVKKIDVFDINGDKCVLRCGLGYDSDIICKTPQSLKNRFGYFAYFIAGIIFALRLKKREYKLTIDGSEKDIHASCIIFANASNMYKNLVSVGNKSELDDGIMDIFILKTTNPLVFYIEFLSILLGIRNNNKRAEYLKAKGVKAENNWLACHIDGEKKIIKNDIEITISEKAVRVFGKKSPPLFTKFFQQCILKR